MTIRLLLCVRQWPFAAGRWRPRNPSWPARCSRSSAAASTSTTASTGPPCTALPALHRIRYGAVAPTFLLPLVHSVTKVFRRHSSFCWRCSQADRSAEGLRPGRDCAQTTGGLRPLRSEHDGPAAKVLDVGESGRRRFWPAEVIQMDHPVRVACLSFTAFHCHFTNFHCLSPRFCLRRSRFDNVFFAAVPPLGSLVRAQQLLSVCLSLRSYSTDCAVFV